MVASSAAMGFVNDDKPSLGPTSRYPYIQSTLHEKQTENSIDLTVAIPTYNGGKRLPAVLEQLQSQLDQTSLTWEVVVADNNSQDETASVVRHYQGRWPHSIPLRYTFVAEQGAAFARQRLVEVARGRIVAFLDDDNIPAPDWVINVHHFAQKNPQAGAFGSQIHGDFESPLPKDLKPMACFLAIIERGGKPHLYEPRKKMLPPGAGLAVCRQAWLQHVPKRLFLNHKGKKAGLASEDLEAVLHIQKAGREIWYNPNMVVYHRIPSARLQADYLRSLIRCIGLSRFYIRMLRLKDWQRPLMIPAYIANDLRKLALHTLKSRHRPESPLTMCEREHLTSTLQSPFFITRKLLQDTYDGFREGHNNQRQQVLRRIELGFEENRFQLYQQPVFLRSQSQEQIIHNEVFIRLGTTNAHKVLLPREFMAVAENYGLARTIDRWVLRNLSPARNGSMPHYSINLSEATVCDPSFIPFVIGLLEQKYYEPKQLCFEVSEKVIMAHPESVLTFRKKLKSLGCQFGLDNFQTSHILKLFQTDMVDCIKVNLISRGAINKQIELIRLQEVIKATGNSVTVVAKGIESNHLLKLAMTSGIQVLQGHRLAVPRPLLVNERASVTDKDVMTFEPKR